MYSYTYWFYISIQLMQSDKLISPNMYEGFMNTEYLCACLKKESYKFEPYTRTLKLPCKYSSHAENSKHIFSKKKLKRRMFPQNYVSFHCSTCLLFIEVVHNYTLGERFIHLFYFTKSDVDITYYISWKFSLK